MDTRKSRRIKRRRLRRVVASVTAVGAIGVSLGSALPAGAIYRATRSNPACNSQYQRDSYPGEQHSSGIAFSNESWC
jgi:hypothetical protein